ncbi:MAG: hypothetical protein MZV70_21930 [Desulfobacterales bacterium]|nr:hypothetical protein [Desulfobacterales bacterium]
MVVGRRRVDGSAPGFQTCQFGRRAMIDLYEQLKVLLRRDRADPEASTWTKSTPRT